MIISMRLVPFKGVNSKPNPEETHIIDNCSSILTIYFDSCIVPEPWEIVGTPIFIYNLDNNIVYNVRGNIKYELLLSTSEKIPFIDKVLYEILFVSMNHLEKYYEERRIVYKKFFFCDLFCIEEIDSIFVYAGIFVS